MNPAQYRLVGGVMIALAVLGWTWSFDQRQRNKQLEETLARVISQRDKLSQVRQLPAATVRQEQAGQRAASEQVRRAAAGFGSDARNLAQALGRMKSLCTAAGLAECQARRSLGTGSSAAAQLREFRPVSGPAGGPSGPPQAEKLLAAYSVTLLATFNPKGLGVLLQQLRSLDMLYRLDRILIAQNRLELDVVFLHSDEIRTAAQDLAERPASYAEGGAR